MTLFILLLFLFSIFFTFDNKPINLLLDFIGIILSLSFFLILSSPSIDLSFFSFIFIIIYGSALAILFAFILMLFSNNSKSDLFSLPSNPSISSFFPFKLLFNSSYTNLSNSFSFNFFKLYFIPFILLFSFSFFFYFLYSYYFISFFFSQFELKSFFSFYLVNFIYNSFIYNPFALILIINILLLGLIGAVFLLI